jgi:hypothetical protein
MRLALGSSSIEAMSQPIIVTLPHQLGKDEAVRRLRASFSDAQSGGAGLFLFKNQWSGDHLDFRASMLGQNTTGTIDVTENQVRLEVQLPWLLSLLANRAKALVEKQGKLMLEKPVKPSTTRS